VPVRGCLLSEPWLSARALQCPSGCTPRLPAPHARSATPNRDVELAHETAEQLLVSTRNTQSRWTHTWFAWCTGLRPAADGEMLQKTVNVHVSFKQLLHIGLLVQSAERGGVPITEKQIPRPVQNTLNKTSPW